MRPTNRVRQRRRMLNGRERKVYTVLANTGREREGMGKDGGAEYWEAEKIL